MHPDFDLSSQIRRFEDQYARNPDSLIFARLADLHRKAGSPRRALEVLDAGLQRHPDYLSAHIVRARALQALDRYQEAEAAYRTVLELDGQNLVALRALAELARERGDLHEARGRYERLLQVDPRNDQARIQLRKLETREEAEPEVEEPEVEGPPQAGSDRERSDAASDGASAVSSGASRAGEGRGEGGAPQRPGPGAAGSVVPAEDRQELAEEVRRIVAEVRERFGRGEAEAAEAPPEEGTGPTPADADETGPVTEVEEGELEGSEGELEEAEAAKEEAGAEEEEAGAEEEEAVPQVEQGAPEAAEADAEEGEGAAADEEAEEELVTETLAQLYASQGFYEEAIEMYEEMSRERPDDPALVERLAAVRARARGEEPEEPPPPLGRQARRSGEEGSEKGGDGEAGERAPGSPISGSTDVDGVDPLSELTGGAGPVPSEAPTPTARQHLRALLRGEAIPGYANQLLREARAARDGKD